MTASRIGEESAGNGCCSLVEGDTAVSRERKALMCSIGSHHGQCYIDLLAPIF